MMRLSTSGRLLKFGQHGFLAFFAAALPGVGCGSDDDPQSTVETPTASAAPDGLVTEAGSLNPVGAPGSAGGGEAAAPGLVGLIDGEDGNDGQNAACVDEFATVSQLPPVIQFVVDTSGSMSWVAGTERLPEVGERSKWEVTQEALAAAITRMPDVAAVGINYYPNTPGGGPSCHVPVLAAPIEQLTPEHRALIERVNAGQLPAGGTPTHAAYEFGVEQLEASALDGSRFVVLITDGIPTFTLACDGDGQARVDGAPLVAAVERRNRDEDIRTFVIGSPGSEAAREELSEMALLGGTGAAGCVDLDPGSCHFDMTGEGDFSLALNAALGDIAEAALGCDFAVPEPPTGRTRINLDDVSVVLESGGNPVREFLRSTSAACEGGWQYNGERTSLSLCRSTCDELNQLVREDPEINVRVKFGCSITPS
jgi:hypothetical protein